MRYYSYSECTQNLNEFLKYTKENSIFFDTIVAISRGGLSVAHLLACAFEIKDLEFISASSYDKKRKTHSLKIKSTTLEIENKKVLLVDDISDSGATFLDSLEILNSYKPLDIFTFSLFFKESSAYKPDYFSNICDEWIEFYWEVDCKC